MAKKDDNLPNSPMPILDACVLINLLATGRLEDVAKALGTPFLICDVVRAETLFLRNPNDPETPKDPIDLSPFLRDGILEETTTRSEDEEAAFVAFATQLDDGEAMTLAIALSRDLTLATDERKARKVFLDAGGHADRLISTPQILQQWSQAASIEITPFLTLIETRARYRPRHTDPLYKWWTAERGK